MPSLLQGQGLNRFNDHFRDAGRDRHILIDDVRQMERSSQAPTLQLTHQLTKSR